MSEDASSNDAKVAEVPRISTGSDGLDDILAGMGFGGPFGFGFRGTDSALIAGFSTFGDLFNGAYVG